MCYYGSWAVYRPGDGMYDVENIDPTLCTHLVYGFVGVSGEGQVTILDSWNEVDKGESSLLTTTDDCKHSKALNKAGLLNC